MHAALLVARGHLLVKNSATGRHPLHIAGGHAALVAQTVSVSHLAGQYVGDSLNSPVGMPGKTGHVIGRIVAAEIVQQQEGIELRGLSKAEGALQPDARSFDGGFGLKNLLHRAKRHGEPPCGLHEIGCAKEIFVATGNFREIRPLRVLPLKDPSMADRIA